MPSDMLYIIHAPGPGVPHSLMGVDSALEKVAWRRRQAMNGCCMRRGMEEDRVLADRS